MPCFLFESILWFFTRSVHASMVYWCILSFFNDWGTGSNPVVGLTITELSILWFFFRVKDLNTSYSDARNHIWHSKFFVLSFLFSTEQCIRWNIMTISGIIEKKITFDTYCEEFQARMSMKIILFNESSNRFYHTVQDY